MSSLELEDLNSAQREAVTAGEGPILILAGAGSGKTRVLTYRIAHLIGERGLAGDSVMAVTFTNKAAGEMRERIGRLLGDPARWPWVSTFHSACARILRQEIAALGYTRNFTIYDDGDALSILRRVIADANLADSPTPEIARSRIEQLKNEGVTPGKFTAQGVSARNTTLAEIYRLYQAAMRDQNALDFGDLILLTATLFEEHPAVLARWQRRFTHLLVDEYQDTNRLQYMLVRKLSESSGNICVVGDEDQSIYRWRGADIRNILDFERDFPHARVFKLEQNYRSTKTILAAADTLIRNNRERKAKTLWTENESGEPITYFTGTTERDEAEFIAREIEQVANGERFKPADVVVFYRTNAQSRVIEEALVRRRVPYYVVGGVRFYERAEVKDLVAYLRAIANPLDSISVNRMIGVPPRGIGSRTIEVLSKVGQREKISLFEALGRAEGESSIALRIAKVASALYEWLRELRERSATMKVRAIIEEIIAQTDFRAYLEGTADGEARKENIAELLTAAGTLDRERGSAGGLEDFLERIALVSDTDQVASDGGRAALMTLHTSKGLEYPVVFIAGMEEGLFPHNRAGDSETEIEEERRLCYVGMTRARNLLYLTNTLTRELYGRRDESRPSRFMAEIDSRLIKRIAPEEPARGFRPPPRETRFSRGPAFNEPYVDYSDNQLPEGDEDGAGFAVGARVIHPTFGPGVVRKREGRGDATKVWVDFERSGVKLLVLKFAHLTAAN
jgi:DNA helicase-2/ATP-dependent DNA helicase PcrA